MAKLKEDLVFVAEEIAEVRFRPSGTFLDVHGKVADFIESKGLFPSWAITDQIVNFKDAEDGPKHFSAWVSYRNAGFVAFDTPTRNQFADKAAQYWTTLSGNDEFRMQAIQRVGIRNKCFIKTASKFEELESKMYEKLFSPTAANFLEGTRKDLLVVFDLDSSDSKIHLTLAPLREREAKSKFQFKSDHFESTGVFVDVDVYAERLMETREVSTFIRTASKQCWDRVEKIAELLGV